MRRRQSIPGDVDELGDAAKPGVVAGVSWTVADQLARHEQCGLRVRRPMVGEGGGHGGVAICLHGGVQGGVLLLAGSGVDGGSSLGFGAAAIAAGHRLRLGHAASPALSVLATCVRHGTSGAEGRAEEQ